VIESLPLPGLPTVVASQAELDAALAAGEPLIHIASPDRLRLRVSDCGKSEVVIVGKSHVDVEGPSAVSAREGPTVTVSGGKVIAHGWGEYWVVGSGALDARGPVWVRAGGHAQVHVWSAATVWGGHQARIWRHSQEATIRVSGWAEVIDALDGDERDGDAA
jgi:hypothetical protein